MFNMGIESGTAATAVRRSFAALNVNILASTRRSYSSSAVVSSDISD
ncbi:hypothetical protein OZX57_02565 [Bifidobacterium sp. ESL0682]|nr:hypothetical protein [Bifidobacterium sp. ESL0682]WEV42367.1 hypothetical protein OZX57_02565 [Bifidobacterium sp. ESL0682]